MSAVLSEPTRMPPATASSKTSTAPRKRHRESRDINLERIRAAAVAEFSLHGLRGATTDAIAHRAGMTRPQLHYYIAGKEELYEELLQSVLAQWAEDKFDHASDDPEAVLRKYIADKVRHASQQPELARMFGLEMLSGAPNLDKYWPSAVQITKAMAKTIDRWIREGRMRKVNAHLLLMNIWAMSSHYAFFAVQVQVMSDASPRVKMDPEEIRREITNLVLAGCGFALT
jgi:TetR/AcrR family transcriptional regulator